MIGYYIHHHGAGHLHRATALATHLQHKGVQVTGLSSVPQPEEWPGQWVSLPRDDDGVCAATRDVTAAGLLHWVPHHHPGLRARMALVSQWLYETTPQLIVVDVSVEVALLARLHGVPVVTVAQPGNRTDGPHTLGYAASAAVVGFWPETAAGIFHRADSTSPLYAVGGLSRFTPVESSSRGHSDPFRVAVLNGTGGGSVSDSALAAIREGVPEAEVTVLGGAGWASDPWPVLTAASVVVTAAGQNSIAEVAASRTPAVVLAHPRPFEEQLCTFNTLVAGPWPAMAAPENDTAEAWGVVLRHAQRLEGNGWDSWCDGAAAERFVAVLEEIR